MDLAKLRHPGWTGVVLPLVLVIASTFTLGKVRVVLLIVAVIASTWTFHRTDWAGQQIKKTGPAACIFMAIALMIFFYGRAVDTPAKAVQLAQVITKEEPSASAPVASPSVANPKPQPKREFAKTDRQLPNPSATHSDSAAAPSIGTIIQGPCGVIQSGGTGNQATGGNCAPPEPELIASSQRQRQTGDTGTPWVTELSFHATSAVTTGTLRLRCDGPVIRAGIGRINPFQFSSGNNGPDPSDPNTAVYELSPEPLEADKEIALAVYSLNPVSVISGSIGAHKLALK